MNAKTYSQKKEAVYHDYARSAVDCHLSGLTGNTRHET